MGIRTFHWNKRNIQSLDRFKESWGPALEERYTLIWAPGYSYVRSARKLFTRAVSSTSLLARRLKTENQNL
jgi:hypothetical protein